MRPFRQPAITRALLLTLGTILLAARASGQADSVSARQGDRAAGGAGAAASAGDAFFEKQIRPVLVSQCAGCHGKDAPQAGLRLDAPFPIEKARDVLARVKGEGGKPRMPLGGQLTAAQIRALQTWVSAGAVWPSSATTLPTGPDKRLKHWSYQPIRHPAVPKVAAGWVRNPIDAFILSGLNAHGLKPNPTASRQELIRRVAYDLTGLPPTPEEVTAFLADSSPDAYAKLVDRLLASPHYGEKWARHWLDLVRYAETNSYERDNPKPNAFRYRDYVIRAFNSDKPYNQFVREQIAGDEMPEASGDTLAATGYYRLGVWDDEPADLKQAEADDTDDLVTTTGQTFLGITIDCARCHDHKFDPIPQKDYYRFASFFRNINRFKNGGPTDEAVYYATPDQKAEYDRKVADLDARRKANQAKLDSQEADLKSLHARLVDPRDLSDVRYTYYEGAYDHIPDFKSLKPVTTGSLNPGLLDIRPRHRDENFAFVFEGTLNVPADGDYTFSLDSDDGSRLIVGGKTVIEKNMLGGMGTEMHGTAHLTAGRVPFKLEYFQGGGPFGLSLAWGGPGFKRRALSTLESCGPDGLPVLFAAELAALGQPDQAAKLAALLKEKTDLAAQQVPVDHCLCVTEAGATAPDTFVLLRGVPTSPSDKVSPRFPICAGGGDAVPASQPNAKTTGRRTALANWLVSPTNPLTARVIVNRVWQWHFGRGIVRTPSDFGLQGARPTHPQLLDWLATEFVAKGWSIKELSRLILMSNAYKQSARANAIGLKKDPQNDLFWRSDMRRLDAEEIRDTVLAVSGNLNLAMFGPSVYPEIPKEILAAQSIPGYGWDTARMTPDDLNRRSLYIHVKRSLVYPILAAFDLPETDRSTAVRFASTQPTQALSTLNGPFFQKQAGVLAARVRKEVGDDATLFARRSLSLVLQRPAKPREVAECVSLMAKLEGRGAKPEVAETYLCLMEMNLNEFCYLD